ncbi:MAG: glycosyltransferase family 39 protein [Chloroflexi bacterium]|nr:glycosyltransferase family 39 protein [Chloroflexota bacterium]
MVVPFLFTWIVACSVLFFALLLSGRRLLLQRPLAAVIAVAVVARLVPLLVFREPTGSWGTDIVNYQTVAELVLAHNDVYDRVAYVFIHPYLPFFMYILAASDWAAGFSGLSFFTVVRLPLVAADVGTAALVFLAAKELRKDAGKAANAGLAYALCPLPILVTVYHGQFDVLPVFFAFLAWYLVYFSKPGLSWVGGAGAALGLGILAKSWPVLLVPALLVQLTRGSGRSTPASKAPIAPLLSFLRLQRGKRLLAFTGATIAVPAVAVMIYLVSFQASFNALRTKNLEHRPPFQTGYASILKHLGNVLPRATDWANWAVDHERLIMYPTLLVVALVVIPRRGALVAIVTLLGAALMTATGGGAHHFIWLVPFALVAGQRRFFLPFIAAAFLSLVVVGFYGGGIYFGFQNVPFGARSLPHMWFAGVIVWSILVLWVLTNVVGSVWKRFYVPSADELDDVDLMASEAESATSRA